MKKLYYSIGEVSQITSIEPHIIRYWETIFNDLDPAKNSSGKRVFTDDHIKLILKLKELIQEKKYSTAGAKKVLKQEDLQDGGQSIDMLTLKKDLNELKLFLQKLKNNL